MIKGDQQIRKNSIEILKNLEQHDWVKVVNALYDLRHNYQSGDEELVIPLLEHENDEIVASALLSITAAYGRLEEYLPLLKQLAWGDPRDDGEGVIQNQAIRRLADYAEIDPRIQLLLREIGESSDVEDIPHSVAWGSLAQLNNSECSGGDREMLALSRNSEASEKIRNRIRNAMDN